MGDTAYHVKVGDFHAPFVEAVYLNGQKVTKVIEFNTDEGWLIRRKDIDVKTIKTSDEWPTEKLTGNVWVKWKQ